MKKITLALLLMSVCLPMFAQNAFVSGKTTNVFPSKAKANHLKSVLAEVWASDFSNPSDWTMSNGAGNTDNWTIGVDGGAGGYSIGPIVSTSAANGFALYDSDLMCSGNQIGYIKTAAPINCSAASNVFVQFESYYREWYSDCFVEVSTNNSTWTSIQIYDAYTNNTASPNPDVQNIDISAVADGQATVWLRFTFSSPSATYAANAGCGYSWMIDDISVYEFVPPADPNVAISGTMNFEYPFVPLTQVAANTYEFGVDVENLGAEITVATDVSIGITGESYYDAAAITIPMATFATESLTYGSNFTPTSINVFEVTWDVTLAGDVDLSDNVDTNYFAVTDSTMGRETGVVTGALGFTPGNEGYFGQHFQIVAPGQEITSVTFFMNAAGALGDAIRVDVYNDNAGVPGSVVSTTGEHTIIVADTLMGGLMTLPITAPYEMTAGRYYVILHQSATGANVGLATTDDFVPGSTWVSFDGVAWDNSESYGFEVTYVLRPNMNNVSSTSIVSSMRDISIFPNPTNGMLNITNADNANVFVYNLMGEVVANNSNVTSMDLSGLANGTYIVKVVADSGVVTKKINLLK